MTDAKRLIARFRSSVAAFDKNDAMDMIPLALSVFMIPLLLLYGLLWLVGRGIRALVLLLPDKEA